MTQEAKTEKPTSQDVSAINPEFFRVSLDLCLFSPVESKLSQIIINKSAIQVGHLRYVYGEGLLKELILRGATSLELDYPNALGLNKLSINKCAEEQISIKKEPEAIQGNQAPKKQDKVKTEPVKVKSVEPSPKQKKASISELPKLELDNFDFGSSVIETN